MDELQREGRPGRLQEHPACPDVAESNEALADFFRQQREPLQRFLLALLRDRAEADDALQTVFLKLVESWPGIRLETARSWLFTVAYREALDLRRRRKRQDAALEGLWARPVWQCGPPLWSAEADAMRGEEIEAVRRALAELPQAQREVVERRMYRQQTFAAIAAGLGCPLGTVLTRMRLALKALSQSLSE
jgi:RNA polymerase sigma-70 factor (ECF subfamily)